MNALPWLPMHALAARIATRELSPVELVEAALARITADGTRLNPFITLTAEQARAQAREAEHEIARTGVRGPLHGIPIVLKDLFATAGVRTTGGSRILGDWLPEEDATVVRLLRAAGAISLGKTGMPEFACAPTSINPHYGPVRNPWNVAYDTAGSSSGTAAAIAAGMAWAGPGSDTGGSIRMPAAACGLVGLKPTWGRVSLKGVLPLCILHDHAGPMARTVRDAALLMQALAWYDPDDPFCRDAPLDDYVVPLEQGIAGQRIAVLLDDGGPPVDPEIQAAFERALATLRAAGAELDELRLPFVYELVWDDIPTIEASETAADYGEWLLERGDDLSLVFREFVASGLAHTGADVQRAHRRVLNQLHQVECALRGYDLLVSPTLGSFPPPPGEERLDLLRFTNLWNANGWPAISVPIGLSHERLPIGLQFVARPWQEALLLRAARVVEQAHAIGVASALSE